MKVAVIHAPHDLRLEDHDVGELGAAQVRIRVKTGGICGSDLHYFHHGGFGAVRLKEPLILGHEVAGVVEAVGPGVGDLVPGDRVAVNPSLPCGACQFCLEGLPNQCLDMRFFGSAMRTPHVQGAFREQLVCEAVQALKIPDGVSFEDAAFGEPLAVCLHAVARAGPLVGRRVLVIGAGPIGALCVLAARRAGAREIVVADLLDEPLALLDRLGADRTHNLQKDPEALASYGAHKGRFDIAFEASGSAAGLTSALAALKPQAVLVQIGLGGAVEVPLGLLVAKEIELRGSFRFHEEFAWALEFIASRAIDVHPLLTEVVPLDRCLDAFALASDRRRAMKVQIGF